MNRWIDASDRDHLVISRRAVLWMVVIMAAIGEGLAVIGVRDAYDKVGGTATREGHIITVAIAVAVVAVIGVVTTSRWRHMNSRKGWRR